MCATCGCDDHSRTIRLEEDVLADNDRHAAHNREMLAARGLAAFNLLSSPGSGKTTLLVRTIDDLRGEAEFAVIEGDQQTDRDAERIRATGAPAVQINTGKGCHLEADMIHRALHELDDAGDLRRNGVLMIENVGNLVCPAGFDLGESARVVVLSVTEGDDKPLKYPDMFRTADLVLISKADLLAHVEFDVAACMSHIHRLQPRADVLTVSAKTGEGLRAWYGWLRGRSSAALAPATAASNMAESA